VAQWQSAGGSSQG